MRKQYLENKVIAEAEYMVNSLSTIRDVAKKFGVSKSAVHQHMTKILPDISSSLYEDVRIVLDLNWDEKNIRGGRSTKLKFAKAN
jgi:putative DeoR family transcriptional regulator (stage III sporulation protein D)